MFKRVICKRPTPGQGTATGQRTEVLSDRWTGWLSFQPEDEGTGGELRESGSRELVVPDFRIYTGDTSLDIEPDDLLYELEDETETGRIYKVLSVDSWGKTMEILLRMVSQ
jgi:hypothetical protein